MLEGGRRGSASGVVSDLLAFAAHFGHDALYAVLVDGLEAFRAHLHRDPALLARQPEPVLGDIRIPAATGLAVRVRDVVAEGGLASCDFADVCHRHISVS